MKLQQVMSNKSEPTGEPVVPLRVGVSSCLVGQSVRFDGGHKRHAYIAETLARYFELVPVCPEMALGLGTPREPIRLVRTESGVRARGSKSTELDVTEPLRSFGRQMADRLDALSGYIWKRASPSCGMERVKVYMPNGMPTKDGRGAFAEEFMAAHPLLPCEEEGRLGDPVLRENFMTRVFVRHRWLTMVASGITRGRLVAFHTDHKLLILAHDPVAYRRLGRMVADTAHEEIDTIAERYASELMTALQRRAGRRQHGNILQRLLGFISRQISDDDRGELVQLIERYREGIIPLIVPLTLFNHHLRRQPNGYAERQYYLQPYPQELALRNLL